MDAANDTLYDVLGVAKDATQAQIKKAYAEKSLAARSENVDKAPGRSQAELDEAYSVLSSNILRAAYDNVLDKQRRTVPIPPPRKPQVQDKPRALSEALPNKPRQHDTMRPVSAPPKAAGISRLDNVIMELYNTEKTFLDGLDALKKAVAHMDKLPKKAKTASSETYQLLADMAKVADEIKAKYKNNIQSVVEKKGDQYQFNQERLEDYIKLAGKAFDLSDKFNDPKNVGEKDKVIVDIKKNKIPKDLETAFHQVPITPAQRLPRYKLLLEQAVKYSEGEAQKNFTTATNFADTYIQHKNTNLSPDAYKAAMQDIIKLVNKLSVSSATKEVYMKELKAIEKDFANKHYPASIKRVEALANAAAANLNKSENRTNYNAETRELHKQIHAKCQRILEGYKNPINQQVLQAESNKISNTANMYQTLNPVDPRAWRVSSSDKQKADNVIVLTKKNPVVNELKIAHDYLIEARKEGKKGVVDQNKMQALLEKGKKHLDIANADNDLKNKSKNPDQFARVQIVINKISKMMNEAAEGLKMLNSPQPDPEQTGGKRPGRN